MTKILVLPMTQMTIKIPAQESDSYLIKIAPNLIDNPSTWLPVDWKNKQIVIITDDNVQDIYGRTIITQLQPANPILLSFRAGETSKNQQTKTYLEEQMLQHHCNRNTLILALGGGVVGDIAGFTAATYMRGVPYIQIPTTLLAMVDSSVGGKTGINTSQGKNLIGAFWQPAAVIIDTHCLNTLTQIQITNGLIEALKMFMTHDKDSLYFTYQNIDQILAKDISLLSSVIERALNIKARIVMEDEEEQHERMTLNFGHTIGHALEKLTHYTMLHGYAVALGILVEAKISQFLSILSNKDYQTIQLLFSKLNISVDKLKEFNPQEIIDATKSDKKNQSGEVKYILLNSIGSVYSKDQQFALSVNDEVVLKVLDILKM